MDNEFLLRLHRSLVLAEFDKSLVRVLFYLLLPLAILYGAIGMLRNVLYRVGIFTSYRSRIPVVSVGNITAGGTGKTPMVDFLAREFQSRGKRPAIVSRGYGGSFSGQVGVVSDSKGIRMSAAEAGDEPVLLAKRHPLCQVLIAPKRSMALKYLEQSTEVDLVILDDGFQHRALGRNADIVLLDAQRPLGNGWPLPAGNLREFKQGLNRADILIRTKGELSDSSQCEGYSVYNSEYRLSQTGISLDGKRVDLDSIRAKKVVAFSGIADPYAFFNGLETLGLELTNVIPLADHVNYSDAAVIEKLRQQCCDADLLLTTEKDAVKLSSDMFDLPCYYVPIDVEIGREKELLDTVSNLLWRK